MSSIEAYDDDGNPLAPGDERWKEIFDELVAKGIIVPDKDAPLCISCQEKLEDITVRTVWILGEEKEIDKQSFKWVPGLHQFVASPSFFRFVEDGMARFEAECSKCGGIVVDLEIISGEKGGRHGLKFGDGARMAGSL